VASNPQHPRQVPPILRSIAFDSGAPVVVADRGLAVRETVRELAARFFERTPRVVNGN
jgi:hypothetical protein